MHTIMMVGVGIVALAAFALGGFVIRRSVTTGAKWFLLPWLAVALVNLYVGTTHGYSVAGELPFFALVFGLPAIAAWLLIRLYGR
jgi:hypothetical protein